MAKDHRMNEHSEPQVPLVRLNTGVDMPQLGLGGTNGLDEDGMLPYVLSALDLGYRLFDTAPRYNNERGLGLALKKSGLPRDEVFVTTKVWTSDQGREATLRSFEGSLERLGFEYVDLFLIHFPAPSLGLYVETWLTLEELHRQGRARSIGVANFEPHHLDEIMRAGSIVPAVNQVELHPRLQQHALRAKHAEHGIRTEAWSPLAMGQTLREGFFEEMAERRSATPAQVILRWHIQQGTIVIPRSLKTNHLRDNIEAVMLAPLDELELAAIAALDCGGRIGPRPDDWVDGPRGSVTKNLSERYETIMQGQSSPGITGY
jgi:2,5-diketo-D-gluconate reductase A